MGDAAISTQWARVQNDLIHRACTLYPRKLRAICMLPQSPGVSPANCVAELTRCVEELDFIGCNLLRVIPVDNILFASEMVGAVRGIDPETGQYFDDTKRYDASGLSAGDKRKVFEGNARKVYSRWRT